MDILIFVIFILIIVYLLSRESKESKVQNKEKKLYQEFLRQNTNNEVLGDYISTIQPKSVGIDFFENGVKVDAKRRYDSKVIFYEKAIVIFSGVFHYYDQREYDDYRLFDDATEKILSIASYEIDKVFINEYDTFHEFEISQKVFDSEKIKFSFYLSDLESINIAKKAFEEMKLYVKKMKRT